MKRAPLTLRFLALSIDLVFLACVSVLLLASGLAGFAVGGDIRGTSSADLLSTLSLLASIFFFFEIFLFLFYFTYLAAWDGKTIGKGIFRLGVVQRRDGAPVGLARSLVRALAYVVSALPLFLGFYMAFLLRGRALHDIIAGTMVVKEE
ncbi:MAG: RDD family protein [Syntrophorhabdales bacterium]|jgi:uncharacterized RDD family membrane protein YckC